MTTAAAAAAAVGAGVFLWSKRNQISEQLSNLSDQISDWTESMRSNEQETSSRAELASRPAAKSACSAFVRARRSRRLRRKR